MHDMTPAIVHHRKMREKHEASLTAKREYESWSPLDLEFQIEDFHDKLLRYQFGVPKEDLPDNINKALLNITHLLDQIRSQLVFFNYNPSAYTKQGEE